MTATKSSIVGLASRIEQAQAQSLLDGNLAQPVSGFVAALGYWLCFYLQMPASSHAGILTWAAMIHATQLHRYMASARYGRAPPANRDIGGAVRNLCVTQAVSGAVWGLSPWLFFPVGDLALVSLMMLMLLCMSSLGTVALSSYRLALLAFNIPIFTGLATALFWQMQGMTSVLAVGSLIYFYSNMRYGFKQNQLLNDSLRARFENEQLAQTLSHQIQLVEKASLEKTRFFASASHDLRQPLHSLGLFGSAIHARLKDTPDEALASNLMHCVDALESSFSAMLDVSKLDAGVVEVKEQPTGLAEVFRRLQAAFGRQAEAQGLSLRFNPAGKWVLADASLLERLLGNLVHNAIKFTATGGVTLLARTRGSQVSIEVWDTGQGMQAQEHSRIFDEFYQVGNQERDRARGLGMGLAIVRRLSDLMRAPLRVASKPGRGSVFKLLLPACTPAQLPQVPAASRSSAFRALTGLRVLVVDDEATVRDSTSAALRLYGLQVEVADGMAQARGVVQRLNGSLDALITDYRLCNGKDGIDLVAELTSVLGRPLPTLLITGDTAPDRVRQAGASGLRVLYKPVRVSDMVEALRLQLAPARSVGISSLEPLQKNSL